MLVPHTCSVAITLMSVDFRLVSFHGQCKPLGPTHARTKTTLIIRSNLLAENWDIQERLRKDCLELDSFKHGELPTPAEIKGMKYLSNVFHEGMTLDLVALCDCKPE